MYGEYYFLNEFKKCDVFWWAILGNKIRFLELVVYQNKFIFICNPHKF